MEKKNYDRAVLNITEFFTEDVITTSVVPEEDDMELLPANN